MYSLTERLPTGFITKGTVRMHNIDRLTAAEKSGVRSAVYFVLRQFAEDGNHGPILMQRLFLMVADELVKTNIIDRPQPLGGRSAGGQKFTTYVGKRQIKGFFPNYGIPDNIVNLVRQTFWELFVQGILAPAVSNNLQADRFDSSGVSDSILDVPDRIDHWVSFQIVMLTPFGVDLLTDMKNRVQVHDPDGYLLNFWGASPSPDPEMMRYLSEGIAVFRNGHLLASVVLLGVASERLTDVLAENIREKLTKMGQDGDTWFNTKYKNKRISDRFAAVDGKLLAEFGPQLASTDLKDPFQKIVKLTFEQLRNARNGIAHPNGREFTWNEVSGFFHNFVQYFIYINQIVDFLK